MRQRGFTLIEIMIVITLISICGYIVADIFIGQNRIYKVQVAELNVTSDARMSLDDIDNFVRQANRVLDSYTTYTTSSQVMVLQIQSVDSSNQLIPAFDTIVYYLTGTNLYREIFPNAGSARPAMVKKIASNVTSLAFTYNNASHSLVTEVTTDITIQENAGIQTRAITISSKSKLRNY